MSETEETCHVTEEVITTEVIVDAGCSTGEIVVADMDNDFVAEEVVVVDASGGQAINTAPVASAITGQRKRELGVFRCFQHRGGERRRGSLGRWQ